MLIWNGNFGGLADTKFSGIEGSFAVCVGIDGHSQPGVLKAQQKLTKNSGSVVDGLCKVKVNCSNGYTFWFSADSGKIWARDTSGNWTLAYTTSAGAGESKCLGAEEFNGYIYWATQSRVHRIAVADADDSWANVSLNYATFDVTDISFHPMTIQVGTQDYSLFIGDGNQVAEITADGTFNSNALDIKDPLRIKTLFPYDIDLLIGTYVADTVNRAEIIRWDCVSPTWNASDPIEESGINAFIRDDNYVYVSAGQAGNIYYYDGVRLVPFKKIPGEYSKTKYGTVHPGSSANFRGVPVFGFSNIAGNPASQGVYSLGSYSRDYRKVMDLSWPISQDVLVGVEIGAICVSGFELLVSWKEGSNYGVDVIDYTTKYASARVETMMIAQGKRDVKKTLSKTVAYYNDLPDNTGVTLSYSKNGADYVDFAANTETIVDEIYNEIRSELSVGEVCGLQIKMSLTTSANDSPVIEALGVDFE